MKATIDIPDDLYRRIKARSAMEGRPVRSVAVELFQEWLGVDPSQPAAGREPAAAGTPTRFDSAPWVKIARSYIRPGISHDLNDIGESVGRGWAAEAARKFGPPSNDL